MNDIWRLRAAAVMYLRYERGCPVVSIERGLGLCVPDVVGVTATRFLIEIEIKQTMADFRKNSSKWGMRHRASLNCQWETIPQQFYFLVPEKLKDKARAELPDGFGLMSLPAKDEPHRSYGGVAQPIVRVKAPNDKRAAKLPIRMVQAMVKHQTGTLSSLLVALVNFVDRYHEVRKKVSQA